jgi:hypothetical protein
MQRPPIKPFPPRRDYASLSMQDLLDARDAYHVYLSTLENVAATAIGRYLIRKDDWYADHAPNEPRPDHVPKPDGPRTLDNSVVRPWSWPAVLVFVREWAPDGTLGNQEVPRALHLKDGRVVPTCVILARPDESLPPAVPGPSTASSLLGGGYSCVRRHQGIEHSGTIGCLVTREGSFYALTNRHVAGSGGEPIGVYYDGEYHEVGRSAGIASSNLPLSSAFPAWPGDRTLLNLEAGLIRIDDVTRWTSQAFGIGEIGEPFDATECTVTLDLIGCPMRAFGGTSGVIEGEIRALFFRYQSLGGIDFATDLLIGGITEPPSTEEARDDTRPFTRPGDSGTLWYYDPPMSASEEGKVDGIDTPQAPDRGEKARRLRPVAMQWGGQRFLAADGSSNAFALASFISTICRELGVQIERGWSTGHDEYWGKIGHFTIGWKACDRLEGKLSTLMKKNQIRIGFDDATIGQGAQFKMGSGAYVPLADVPDYVWVRDHKNRDSEGIQHFADIDIVDIEGGDSLLERGRTDRSSVAASVWKEYFDGFAAEDVGPEEGALPFRVWQIWEEMVAYLRGGDVLRFVAAAGVLAHYVGDASQPLHCSYMHHGKPPMKTRNGRRYPVPRTSKEFKAFKETPEAKIHSLYEEGMLEIQTPAVLQQIDTKLGAMPSDPDRIKNGHDAACEILRMMNAAQDRLSPDDIIKADDPALKPKPRAEALRANKKLMAATITSLADSTRLLADLWASAWREGDGDSIAASKLKLFTEKELNAIYRGEKDFLPSLSLADMAASGRFEPPAS